MDELANRGDSKYRRVRGWLLLLCVVLTIVAPLSALSYIYKLLYLEGRYGDTLSGLSGVVTVSIVMTGILAVFSLVAGLSLWSIRPTAVPVTKISTITI